MTLVINKVSSSLKIMYGTHYMLTTLHQQKSFKNYAVNVIKNLFHNTFDLFKLKTLENKDVFNI